MDTTYNGWTNHATWCVGLWLNDDVQSWVSDAPDEDWDQESIIQLYRDLIEELLVNEEISTGLLSDLITGYLADVNWRELADHIELPVVA
jgi:hypothetical protein